MCSFAACCSQPVADMSMQLTKSMVHEIHANNFMRATMSCAMHSCTTNPGQSSQQPDHLKLAHREPESKAAWNTEGIQWPGYNPSQMLTAAPYRSAVKADARCCQATLTERTTCHVQHNAQHLWKLRGAGLAWPLLAIGCSCRPASVITTRAAVTHCSPPIADTKTRRVCLFPKAACKLLHLFVSQGLRLQSAHYGAALSTCSGNLTCLRRKARAECRMLQAFGAAITWKKKRT